MIELPAGAFRQCGFEEHAAALAVLEELRHGYREPGEYR
jgi:hypothetical protein